MIAVFLLENMSMFRLTCFYNILSLCLWMCFGLTDEQHVKNLRQQLKMDFAMCLCSKILCLETSDSVFGFGILLFKYVF